MEFHVRSNASLSWTDDKAKTHTFRCALGRSGIGHKTSEGDGITPIGHFPLRRLWYRADRLDVPETGLLTRVISEADGWCDAPDDLHYNQHVTLPFETSCENLWRDDGLYDLIIEIGYNDAPVIPGKGSAIFMHVARKGFEPTEGCVALKREDLLDVLRNCNAESRLIIDF